MGPKNRVPLLFVLAVCLAAAVGCGDEDTGLARRTLDVILQDDLSAILADIPEHGRIDSAYLDIIEYRTLRSGDYRALAQVEFHVVKGDIAVVVRKYGYMASWGRWDRFYSKYHHRLPSTVGDSVDEGS